MAMKKGGLGRGLDAILLDNDAVSESGATVVRISEIEPNAEQPRKNFNEEELSSLAESIAEYGLIQPITVRKVGERYKIVAGERRWRAARMAGLSEVPVNVISNGASGLSFFRCHEESWIHRGGRHSEGVRSHGLFTVQD